MRNACRFMKITSFLMNIYRQGSTYNTCKMKHSCSLIFLEILRLQIEYLLQQYFLLHDGSSVVPNFLHIPIGIGSYLTNLYVRFSLLIDHEFPLSTVLAY